MWFSFPIVCNPFLMKGSKVLPCKFNEFYVDSLQDKLFIKKNIKNTFFIIV